jgi:hypothetical protein
LEDLDSQRDALAREEFVRTVLNPNDGGLEHNDPVESGGEWWILGLVIF